MRAFGLMVLLVLATTVAVAAPGAGTAPEAPAVTVETGLVGQPVLDAEAPALSQPSQEVPPGGTVKVVQLDCDRGWRGSAQGTYGGISFGVFCNNGRGKVRLEGTSGTAYSIRAGAESDAIAVDCFFTGDANAVNESCGGVRLSIH